MVNRGFQRDPWWSRLNRCDQGGFRTSKEPALVGRVLLTDKSSALRRRRTRYLLTL